MRTDRGDEIELQLLNTKCHLKIDQVKLRHSLTVGRDGL